MPKPPIVFRTRDDEGREIDFVFRVPALGDILKLEESLPLLPIQEKELETKTEEEILAIVSQAPERMKRLVKRCDFLVTECSLRPKIVDDDGLFFDDDGNPRDLSKLDGEPYPLGALGGRERLKIGFSLFGLSGYNEEAAVELLPLSGTGGSSNSSTPSGNGMDDSRTSSSETSSS